MKYPVAIAGLLVSMIVTSRSSGSTQELEELLSKTSAKTLATGQRIYEKHCFACHAPSNIMVPSPKPGNLKDWSERFESNKGLKGTIESARKGKGAMPAKGLCLDCKDKDLEAAILFMMKGF